MSVFYMPPVDEPCTRGPHMRFKKMVQLGKYASPSHLAHKPVLYTCSFLWISISASRFHCVDIVRFTLCYYRMLSIISTDVICQVVVAIMWVGWAGNCNCLVRVRNPCNVHHGCARAMGKRIDDMPCQDIYVHALPGCLLLCVTSTLLFYF